MQRTLVAFDTNHIKGYVFGTDKLKEIRGASSILDDLNRKRMIEIAEKMSLKYKTIYTNGGSGLFLVEADEQRAKQFAQRVQQAYIDNGASITYVMQELPKGAPEDEQKLMNHPLDTTLNLLRHKMRLHKDCAPEFLALPSHPFMRPCVSCGINYAEEDTKEMKRLRGPDDDPSDLYCISCQKKQIEDSHIKSHITRAAQGYRKFSKEEVMAQGLWDRIVYHLIEANYVFSRQDPPGRPQDFNIFRQFTKSKEYLGLIYADANNMGTKVEGQSTLTQLREFALDVDSAIHHAMSAAIVEHLPVVFDNDRQPLFPFDLLLLGGDDIMMVTDAAKAMDVALTITKKFRDFTKDYDLSLSVGVVLAPVNYPFSLLRNMAEETLKAAKKGSAESRVNTEKHSNQPIDDTRISFLTITGGSMHSYKKAINLLEKGTEHKIAKEHEFHATLRPYDPETLRQLLNAIHEANTSGINRSKLHQMRAAILKMNVTTSVSESLAALQNWQPKQRDKVVQSFYKIGMSKTVQEQGKQEESVAFPRVTFPWFRDDHPNQKDYEIYRTSILDFIELYDFVHREDRNANTAK